MTGGSLNLRLYRRARRDGETLERACEISGLTHGEARLTDAEDARNPPPPEAFELIGHNRRDTPMEVKADDQLRLFAERIIRLQEERKGVSDDIRDTYAEAAAQGYDKPALREVIKLMGQDEEKRKAHQAMVELYGEQLGLF
jgi:uncharacterized protein (UPF0335 family)